MDKICIKGGVPLEGVIPIGGAKNAALPLMAASLLTSETLTLKNVPVLADIATMANLLVQHGVSVLLRPSTHCQGEPGGRARGAGRPGPTGPREGVTPLGRRQPGGRGDSYSYGGPRRGP